MNTGHSYSALLVSSSDGISKAFEEIFHSHTNCGMSHAFSVREAAQMMETSFFDFIIINAPLTDENGIVFASECVSRLAPSSSVLIIVPDNIYEQIGSQVEDRGVFVVTKPTTMSVLRQALSWMTSARERIRKMEQQTTHIEKKLHETKLIDRAKCLLISNRYMTENDAHKYIERHAMDSCVSKVDIAHEIIEAYSA